MSTQLTEKQEKRIWSFASEQTVLNFATSVDDVPWCASCFYVFNDQNKLLVFKSDKETRHIEEALRNDQVAGTILPNKFKPTQVIGIQFQGKMIVSNEELLAHAKKLYYQKYPYAKVMAGDIWVVELTYVKFTDNQLGFGKKLIWKRD